jgi:hypothetical protein
MDIRKVIQKRLGELGWSTYRLVEAVKGKVPASSIYGFIAAKHSLNSDHLGHVFDVLGLTLVGSKRKAGV